MSGWRDYSTLMVLGDVETFHPKYRVDVFMQILLRVVLVSSKSFSPFLCKYVFSKYSYSQLLCLFTKYSSSSVLSSWKNGAMSSSWLLLEVKRKRCTCRWVNTVQSMFSLLLPVSVDSWNTKHGNLKDNQEVDLCTSLSLWDCIRMQGRLQQVNPQCRKSQD